jgi:hypothetical protein
MHRLGCRKVAIADSAWSKRSEEYVADKIPHLLDSSLHFCLKSIGKTASQGLSSPPPFFFHLLEAQGPSPNLTQLIKAKP